MHGGARVSGHENLETIGDACMKVTICGKGGCGKSTVTSLLAKALARRGNEVLVIDSDESNYGLHRQLGMELPGDFTGYFGGKENVLNDMMLSKFTHQFFQKTWTMKDIPEKYYSLKDGVKLMVSGKIHQANEGCSCAMGTVMTQFVQNLRLAGNQFALLDMEAGVEHFGRGIDNGVDLVLMIVDPSYESLQLSKKVGELAESIGKPFYYVLNKVTEDSREMMYENVWRPEQVAVCLGTDPAIMKEGLTGKELSEKPETIERLAEFLISLASKQEGSHVTGTV